MFSKIKASLDRISTAIEILPVRLEELLEPLQTPERLSALEGQVSAVVNEARALITEADARFAAARASEERNRHQVKRLERLQELDEGDEEGDYDFEELQRIVQRINAEGGAGGGVPPVREDLDPYGEAGEAAAERWKWNGSL